MFVATFSVKGQKILALYKRSITYYLLIINLAKGGN